MSKKEEIRSRIEQLIDENGLNFRKVSLMIGKGDSYMQRFVRLGLPDRLPEVVRKQLANILHVNEQELTDLPVSLVPTSSPNSASIKIVDIVACCGNGIEALSENIIGTWDIPIEKYKDFSTTSPENTCMFQVAGDSMQPTLNSGDWVVADVSQNYISVDGLYLIRTASGLSVKRILSGLTDISVISDNSNYPNFTASIGEITILGRIIYILNARKIG